MTYVEARSVPGECTGCRREKPQQRTCDRCQGTGNEPRAIAVVVWVCDKCANYFASSSAGDLAAKMNTKFNSGEPTHSRSRCPDCGADRKAHTTVILVPVEDAKVTA